LIAAGQHRVKEANLSKTILITGASRGIGAATARLAGQSGYDVAVNYAANEAAANAVVADVRKAGGKAVAIRADVASPEQIEKLFAAVDDEFGRLDAFFNNAGIINASARFVDIAFDRLQRMIAVNTIGAFVAAQQAVRRMSIRFGGLGGVIVNMSSLAAKLGGANESTDYAMSKGAIDTLTVGLAKELASEGIRVNAVRPGLIYTDIHESAGAADRVDRLKGLVPMQRGGTAEEVAEAVLWLCSDQASYCTGVLLDVGGGRGL
jgi:NAD(P)-dependent dehydrogenase (short-subunit alcohol dehydrogenase family)